MNQLTKLYFRQFLISTFIFTISTYIPNSLLDDNNPWLSSLLFGITVSIFFIWLFNLKAKSVIKKWGYTKLFPEVFSPEQTLTIERPISVKELVQKIVNNPYLGIKEKNIDEHYLTLSINRPESHGLSTDIVSWKDAGDGNLIITLMSKTKLSWKKFDGLAYHFDRVKYLETVFQ